MLIVTLLVSLWGPWYGFVFTLFLSVPLHQSLNNFLVDILPLYKLSPG